MLIASIYDDRCMAKNRRVSNLTVPIDAVEISVGMNIVGYLITFNRGRYNL